jgi:two-component system chemotaxis response regulator CheY
MATEAISKRGVLIADQSQHMAALVAVMLRSIGRKDIKEVYDANSAMTQLKRRAFDVIIVADDLEGMDGVAFTKKLRAAMDCQNRLVPVIMMSAAPDAKRIAEARDAGVTEFLRKPFAANHLQSRLTNIEANPRGFIEAREYVGPDRRRKTVDVGKNDRREGTLPKAS